MKTYTSGELKEIVRLHGLWLEDPATGSRANLRGANLGGAYLVGADLGGAYLTGANLTEAYLTGANLTEADLGGANLTEANLTGANLTGSTLTGSTLGGANLTGANLGGANLTGANLGGANLRGANLGGANLRGANLGGANLTEANLYRANLTEATLPPFQIVPGVGQFRAFKKVQGNVVLELLIPRSAQRTSTLVGRKCRASKVKVVGVASGTTTETVFRSHRDEAFTYEVGKWASVSDYDGDIRVECTKGIHFFPTLKEAQDY